MQFNNSVKDWISEYKLVSDSVTVSASQTKTR